MTIMGCRYRGDDALIAGCGATRKAGFMANENENIADGLREGLATQQAKRPPVEATKSMLLRDVPEWVHEDYRMLKALAREHEPECTINGLLVEALVGYLPLAYAKRGLEYDERQAADE